MQRATRPQPETLRDEKMDVMSSLLSDIKEAGYTPLTLAQELAFAKIIQSPDTPETKRQDTIGHLILGNIRFIRQYVRRYVSPNNQNYLDMLGDALVGCTIAAQRYNPAPDNPGRFISYASFWMKQVILERVYDSRGVNVPAQMRKFLRILRDYTDDYFTAFHTDPSSADICAFMGITTEQLGMLNEMQQEPLSLNAPLPQFDNLTSETIIAASSQDFDDAITDIANQQVVHDALAAIAPRHRRLLQIRYGMIDGQEYTLERVGWQFALVRQQISTLDARARISFTWELAKRLRKAA